MDENKNIKPYKPSNDIVDFDYLKQKGVESIQKYAGKVWTDYNTHDPGITILETLCFTLTEMGYRCKYPIKDLLVSYDKSIIGTEQITADKILFTNPLTKNDFRKLVLNFSEIRNAWIEPDDEISDFVGLWKIKVETFQGVDQKEIKRQIFDQLNCHRNICENFSSIDFVEYEEISFILDIEIDGNVSVKDLTKIIYQKLEDNLNPTCHYYGLDELLSKGYSTDEIFVGTKPQSGFILEDELQQLEQKTKIYASDIYHLVMNITGVSDIKKLRIVDSFGKVHKWVYSIVKGKSATLDIEKSQIQYFHLDKQIKFNHANISFDREFFQNTVKSSHKNLSFKLTPGNYRNIEDYRSVQNDFPEVYGVGQAGLPVNVPAPRRAQAKQLKAYLMLFDQLNVNFLSQLENISSLLSIGNANRTYFVKALLDIPEIELLYVPFLQICLARDIDLENREQVKKLWTKEKISIEKDIELKLNQIIESEHSFTKRRNRLLDHLLARFSYTLDEYNLNDDVSDESLLKLIQKKIMALQKIELISTNKIKSTNIFEIQNDTYNSSGFQLVLHNLLGLNTAKLNLNKTFEISNKIESQETPHFKFYDVNQKDVPKLISSVGCNNKYYQVLEEDKHFNINLISSEKKIATYSEVFENKQLAQSKIEELVSEIQHQNSIFETVYYFEHILLSPPFESRAFHFQFNDELGNPVFSSSEAMTFEERKKAWKQIQVFGQNADNYVIKNIDFNQYKFSVLNNHKREIALSNMFFHDEDQVKTMITSAVNSLKKIAKGTISEAMHLSEYAEIIRPDYKFNDIYSNIITFALPNWIEKFQEDHVKAWIENKLLEHTPAHIYSNIIWLDYEELILAVNGYHEILSLKQQFEIDADLIYQKQKELFNILL